ncbi:MAG: nucleoside triphosphate pyrophosphohydrolase [Bacilli bacterium]|nr:nucleoside triphosphate pyrophosphohydrolase [Bacilli bacterium]
MEKIFNKLVRDRIPEKIENNGEVAVTRILSNEEYREELYKKLIEEANEVINADDKESIIEELADVYEVLKSIAELESTTIEEVIDEAKQKREKRGGFSKRIFLEKTQDR